jgi:hypothetical protein
MFPTHFRGMFEIYILIILPINQVCSATKLIAIDRHGLRNQLLPCWMWSSRSRPNITYSRKFIVHTYARSRMFLPCFSAKKGDRMVWVLKQGSQITSVQLGGWTWQVSAVSLQPHHLRFKTNTKKRCVEAWTWNRLTPFTPINLPLPLPKRFYNLSILIYGSYKPHYLYARLLPHYDHIRIEHTTLWGVPWASAARQKKTRCTWPTSKGRQKQNG